MDLETWYEDIRKGNEDFMPAFDKLTPNRQGRWQIVYSRYDNMERELKQAYEIIGKLIALYPDLLPTVEA
jgi:hypothetical protein